MPLVLRPIKLAVFDLDDTLCLERDFMAGGFRAVAEHLAQRFGGQTQDLERELLELHKAGCREKFQRILDSRAGSADPGEIQKLIEVYRTADRPLALLADAERMLERTRRAGLHLAILTDGPLAGQKTKVRLLGLEHRVDLVFYTAEAGEKCFKPSSAGFQRLAGHLGCPHDRCVYVADNEKKDFAGPNRLGWHTVKVERPEAIYVHHRAQDPLFKPDATVASLDEIELLAG